MDVIHQTQKERPQRNKNATSRVPMPSTRLGLGQGSGRTTCNLHEGEKETRAILLVDHPLSRSKSSHPVSVQLTPCLTTPHHTTPTLFRKSNTPLVHVTELTRVIQPNPTHSASTSILALASLVLGPSSLNAMQDKLSCCCCCTPELSCRLPMETREEYRQAT